MNEPDTPASPVDAATERAISTFLRQVRDRFNVRDAFLFGSRARGTHSSDSDADVAIVLAGARGDRFSAAGDMAGIAFRVLLETGVMVQATPFWEDEWETPRRFTNPALIDNILREGLRL